MVSRELTRARRTAPLMRLPRSAFLFFRGEEYTVIFSGPTLRSQGKDSDWKICEPRSIRRFATLI